MPHTPTRAAAVSAGVASRALLVAEEAQEQLQADQGGHQDCSPASVQPQPPVPGASATVTSQTAAGGGNSSSSTHVLLQAARSAVHQLAMSLGGQAADASYATAANAVAELVRATGSSSAVEAAHSAVSGGLLALYTAADGGPAAPAGTLQQVMSALRSLVGAAAGVAVAAADLAGPVGMQAAVVGPPPPPAAAAGVPSGKAAGVRVQFPPPAAAATLPAPAPTTATAPAAPASAAAVPWTRLTHRHQPWAMVCLALCAPPHSSSGSSMGSKGVAVMRIIAATVGSGSATMMSARAASFAVVAVRVTITCMAVQQQLLQAQAWVEVAGGLRDSDCAVSAARRQLQRGRQQSVSSSSRLVLAARGACLPGQMAGLAAGWMGLGRTTFLSRKVILCSCRQQQQNHWRLSCHHTAAAAAAAAARAWGRHT